MKFLQKIASTSEAVQKDYNVIYSVNGGGGSC